MRKTPTEDQRARAAERRERFRALAKQIADMTPEARQELAQRMPVMRVEDGRPLSVHNTCLVVSQCPTATLVGGFRQWIRAGRAVRKGEHGISIWVPTGGKSRQDAAQGGGATSGADVSVFDAPADAIGLESPAEVRFVGGYVFDVSQTDEIASPAEVATAA